LFTHGLAWYSERKSLLEQGEQQGTLGAIIKELQHLPYRNSYLVFLENPKFSDVLSGGGGISGSENLP
jgi:hypothetical protein